MKNKKEQIAEHPLYFIITLEYATTSRGNLIQLKYDEWDDNYYIVSPNSVGHNTLKFFDSEEEAYQSFNSRF